MSDDFKGKQTRNIVESTILSTGPVLPIVDQMLSRYGQIQIASATDERSLIRSVKGKLVLIVRGTVKISANVIEAGQDLRVIGRTGAGYDNIDMGAATKCGIPVVFAPGAGARAVAEGAMAMILALVKRLAELDRRTRKGEWSARDSTAIGDLQGTTLGIVGLGRIGREVSHLALAFGMRVLAYDPYISAESTAALGVSLVDLNFLLAESDCITLHVPLNSETRGLISRHFLSLIKPGAVMINLSRGGLFESLDLVYDALNCGKLSALGMDVYPEEPPDISHPIFNHPNALCTPHAMGLSNLAAKETFTMVGRGIVDVLEGRIPSNLINTGVLGRRQKTE
jgi:D-3-phosphoglycerate dehydrogenase / 2-oxoglutarate reductase